MVSDTAMLRQTPKTLLVATNEALRVYAVAVFVAIAVLAVIPAWVRWTFLFVVGVAFLTSVIAPQVGNLLPRSRVLSEGKAVFVSGCDSGFGHSLAQQLDDRGFHVFAGCLFPEAEGATSLKATASQRLHIVPLDVTSDKSISNAATFVKENLNDKVLWAVVNNAGISDGAEILWSPVDTIQHVMDVNTMGMVKMTKAFLTTLVKYKGRVVNVCSAAGRYAYPGLVPYCMSKCAAVSFSEGLRMEMYRFGLKVVTIEPWMYKTPIAEESYARRIAANAWEKTSSEVKDLFPKDYEQRYIRCIKKFINYDVNDQPQQVVDCLIEAVMAVNPKYIYGPGNIFSKTSHWFLCRLPKPIADYIISDKFSVSID